MTVFSRAPMRIDFAGGWTDVPEFAGNEGGTVVNAAIEIYAHVEFRLGGGKINLVAEDLEEREVIESSARIHYGGALSLHKAALNMLPVTGGIEIISNSDAPPGSGLGGSASLDVALLAGLAYLRRETFSAVELAELAFMLESVELGLRGGRQDQYAAALGGFTRTEYQAGLPRIHPLNMSAELARDLERHLVLVYSGQTHFSSQTHERVWSRYRAGDEQVAGALSAIRDVAGECQGALESGNWWKLGVLIDENWRNQQQLDITISTEATRQLEQAVRGAGAWALKATGAGAGGCIAILCEPDDRARVCTAARSCGGDILAYRFSTEGVAVWEHEDVADLT